MSQALYRKYRSKSLADVVGQGHITDLLMRALKANKVAHAYLFTGPRGVGKTSIARILAHEINSLPYTDDSNHLDIIEIDAASNNGVDDVRDLREKVQIAPVSASKKVYIIDEVHMLSKQAFNALLKTLEEPPEHVVFILATTDADKLPATVVSRTQRFVFRSITADDAMSHLKSIAKSENITIDDESLRLIAERGEGSFRDSISLLDQLSSLADSKTGITATLIEETLGLAPSSMVTEILTAVAKHDPKSVASLLSDAEAKGINLSILTSQIISVLQKMAPDKPQILPLLDSLLDVPRSSYPSIKLLSVLGGAALPNKPKSAALATPVLEVSATIEELEHQATQPSPSATNVQDVPRVAVPTPKQMKASSVHTSTPEVTVDTPAPTERLAPSNPDANFDTFSWDIMLAHAKEHYIALSSVISKCEYEIKGDLMTIFTVNAFYKKKLDDPKYASNLYESIVAAGGQGLVIETIPERAPMKDSQAAAIADIMGGGVEVSLGAE